MARPAERRGVEAHMHEWMCADLRFICMRVYSSAFLHLMQEGRGVGGWGCEKGGVGVAQGETGGSLCWVWPVGTVQGP